MEPGFAAPATNPPAMLPIGDVLAALAYRPQRDPGPQPSAAIVLVEVDVKGLDG
jgi:hypothetical protein